eukprot:55898_1
MTMFAVLIRGLPLGVDNASLRRCIEEALDDRPVFPVTPKIVDDEALVYLPSRDYQTKLASCTVRCAGTIVSVQSLNNIETTQWIKQREPAKKQNPAPQSNIQQFVKQQQRQQRKINQMHNEQNNYDANPLPHPYVTKAFEAPPRMEEAAAYDLDYNQCKSSLQDQLPLFNQSDAITWYQYLVDGSYTTFTAEWSWDLEGQWLVFEKEYALNPKSAEKCHSDTYVESDLGVLMVDLLHLKAIDKSNKSYELKRTDTLMGSLNSFGRIEFERKKDNTEIFLYDRRTGYDQGITENDTIHVGDRVMFKVWWNKQDNDDYTYDMTHVIEPGTGNVHFGMFAFNVRRADNIPSSVNMNQDPYNFEYLNFCNMPLIVNEIKRQHIDSVHGLVVLLNKGEADDTGLIVCYPFADQPDEHLMLMYHSRFLKDVFNVNERLKLNMVVECCIGLNPSVDHCGGKGLFKYVAIDIGMSDHIVMDPFPVTLPPVERAHHGRVVVAPVAMDEQRGYGFIYNETARNMVTMFYDSHVQFNEGMHVRFNEYKKEEMHSRTDYVAIDVIPNDRVDCTTYYSDHSNRILKYNAQHYVKHHVIRKDRNIVFDCVKESECRTDVQWVVEQSLSMNNDRNTIHMYGVDNTGHVIGQSCMSKAKRHYVKSAIQKRFAHFHPDLSSDCLSIAFKPVVDEDGSILADVYVIIVNAANDKQPLNRMDKPQEVVSEYKQNDIRHPMNKSFMNRSTRRNDPPPLNRPMHGTRNNEPPEQPPVYEHAPLHTNSRAAPPQIPPQIQSAAMRAFPIQPDPIMVEDDEKTLQHTTPELNAKPIPPDTEEGRRQLTVNLQIKINAMHAIDAYKGADEIPNAMSLMEAGMYGAMSCAWEMLISLENNTINQIESNKINKRNDIKMQQADAVLARSVHQLRSQPPMQAIKQILNANRFNEKVEAVAMGLNDNVIPEAEILVDDMSCLDLAQHIDKDEHGLPILPDKSKYKAVALEFCQKMGWKKPTEVQQYSPSGIGYRGTVTFGKPGKERSASGEGTKQKSAVYDAYMKLVPVVIPKLTCLELMAKWLPGYVKQKKVCTSTMGDGGQSITRHPKSIFLEWSQKNGEVSPKPEFEEFSDASRNMRVWSCRLVWKEIEFVQKGAKKKDAESQCFQELLHYVMNNY